MAKRLLNAMDRDTLYLGLSLIWLALMVAASFAIVLFARKAVLPPTAAALLRQWRSVEELSQGGDELSGCKRLGQ